LITEAIRELRDDEVNPSHLYARMLKEAIREHFVLDHLPVGDVLIALRNAGHSVDAKSGVLQKAE